MLTPDFFLSQDDKTVTIVMRTPFIKTQDVEISVEDKDFVFYASPYYLRLELPGRLVEDERMRAKYDVSTSEITISIYKLNEGEDFPNLDLLTLLLAKKPGKTVNLAVKNQLGNPIEVLGPSGAERLLKLEADIKEKLNEDPAGFQEPTIDWNERHENIETTFEATYGFNNQYSKLGDHIYSTSFEIVKIPGIDNSTTKSRREFRLMNEDNKFDEEHYKADYMDVQTIDPILKFEPVFYGVLKAIQDMRHMKSRNVDILPEKLEWLQFTKKEKQIMLNIPNREYLIDCEKSVYLGLVDLTLSYCYDHRTTLSDHNVETPWTISTISSLLSSFDVFDTLDDVLRAFLRRCLSYPLYRNFNIAQKCLKDTCILFKLGRVGVLKALLSIKDFLDMDERTHILSNIWMTDYCCWVQKCDEATIYSIASALNNTKLTKEVSGWDLKKIEDSLNS